MIKLSFRKKNEFKMAYWEKNKVNCHLMHSSELDQQTHGHTLTKQQHT